MGRGRGGGGRAGAARGGRAAFGLADIDTLEDVAYAWAMQYERIRGEPLDIDDEDREGHDREWTAAMLAEDVAASGYDFDRVFSLKRGNAVEALAMGDFDTREGKPAFHLVDLAVSPQVLSSGQGGTGRAMIRQVREAVGMPITVSAPWYSQGFYKRVGFKQTGERKGRLWLP